MKSLLPFLGMLLMLSACVNDGDFDAAKANCSSNVEANATFSQVKNLYQGELLQIQEDWVIEGYVVSSDRAGNFFSVLYFQDNPTNPTEGFQIEIDVRDNHLLFPVGSKILVKLKGLYLGQSKDVFSIGGTFAGFGTTSVGRLPALKVPEHIFISCDEPIEILPLAVSIPELNVSMTNTLVRFQNMEIAEQELDSTFAAEREETERTLLDCSDNELTLLNSGFSDFQQELLPQGNGSLTGVLLRENDDYFLAIRDLNDIDFSNDRCEEVVTEFTSNRVFISELADPDNNASARFVELYNADTEPLDLNGWTLNRYTNANTEVSSSIDLSGTSITGESALVISPNADEFELVYGFAPDLAVGTNSPADSNGDDNLELVDPFGTVIDIFGVIGEDGSGTNHEFEDGRALRNSEISEGNPTYTFSEWTIFNDTGDAGTVNLPQNAPQDFTPGFRN
jgi:hypothetical protein